MKKRILNELKVVFPAKSVNESLSRMIAAAFLAQMDPTIDELADLKTAVSEAVTNAIVHGYGGNGGEIRIHARYYDTNVLKISVRDTGSGIENVERAMEPLFTTDTTGERSGMGFAIMRTFCDKVKVRSSPGKGTTVTLEKEIHKNG